MLKLNITPKAESDLIGIWMHTCQEWGADRADEYLDQLERGMKHLVEHPSLGTNYEHVLPGYRRLQVEHHAVFYQVFQSSVLVVRVLHEGMDAPERLLD